MMKMLADKRIKRLFLSMLACAAVFTVCALILMRWPVFSPALSVLLCGLLMAAAMLLLCMQYFKEQNVRIQEAVTELIAFREGRTQARLACSEEGELARLFHEVNSLAAVLNAHAENESKAKAFLKDSIADISHQLKTPLAALNIYNGILQDDPENKETVKTFTDLSEQELIRIETLVQSLLKITKMDAGTVVFEKQSESVAQLLSKVQAHFSFRAAKEQKQLSVVGEPGACLVCDRVWMTEALDNLVKNALDHTKKGDSIRIVWKQYPGFLQIRIEDNGSGIHPEDFYHIFKRFYRSQFSQDTQGVGLGLPLAKAILEAHGASIRVESELGAGTVFIIEFLAQQASQNASGVMQP